MAEPIELRKLGRTLPVSVQVGKNGLTPSLVSELRKQLTGKGVIKVRLLKSALEGTTRDAVVASLVLHSDALLVEMRGLTVLLARKGGTPRQSVPLSRPSRA